MTALAGLLFCLWSASTGLAGLTYYVSTNGSSGNTGLSTNSPWTLPYALAKAGVSNTIIVLPGVYSGGPWKLVSSWQTIKSQTKWGAWLVDSPLEGIEVAATDWSVNGVTIDGLVISNAMVDAILFFSGSNHTVRNCWVQHTGLLSTDPSCDHSGIYFDASLNFLLEDNLIEHNGIIQYEDHGIYASGTNCVIRNNVIRYNKAFGIQIYSCLGIGSDHCSVYNNLVYSNSVGGALLGISEMVLYPERTLTTNWVYGNTFVTTNTYAIQVAGSGWFANNIIISSGPGFYNYGTVYADYNLAPTALTFAGPHDVVTSYFGFVNPPNGLYWLEGDSPARGKAFTEAYGPVDFFGDAQSSVADIGAFQYSATLTRDPRVLDPPPASPDYWLQTAPPRNLQRVAGPAPLAAR
jgi:hypothetical protein